MRVMQAIGVQAVRRAGWNAVTFNYRGSWGSPGVFRFRQNIEDAAAVLAHLRLPAAAPELGIDTQRLAIAGHSLGGWVTVHTAADAHVLVKAIKATGGTRVTEIHIATDHSWSDHRIAQQVAILNWLASLSTP